MRVQVIAAAALLLSASAAQGAPPKLVLLPPDDASYPTLAQELEAALASVGHKTERSALRLEDLMLAVECSNATVGCLQKIGANLGASALVLGEITRAGEKATLGLRLFDVESGGDRGRTEVPLVGETKERTAALEQAARALFGVAAEKARPTGGLSITATVPYVEILVDGQPRGTAPVKLRGLSPRSYRVEARLSGHSTWRDTVEVEPGKTAQIEIEMHAVQSKLRTPTGAGFLESIQLRTWLVAGIGAGCLVAGIGFGAHMRAQQNELDSLEGDTFAEISSMEELKNSGERDALAANILLGVGGAALVASAVLAYLDYRHARAGLGGEREAPAALRLGPGGAGLTISF